MDESRRVIEQLQEEINEMKEMHAREIMCVQQENAVQREKYEHLILRMRREANEAKLFKRTIEVQAAEMPSFVRAQIYPEIQQQYQ